MLQLWLLDTMKTAANGQDKVIFPRKDFSCGLNFKTNNYSSTWTDGRLDELEAQQVLRDLADYTTPFIKKYKYIIWFFGLIFIIFYVIIIYLITTYGNDEISDFSDTDAFDEDIDDENNLWTAVIVFSIIWFILIMSATYLKAKVITAKLQERAAQINVTFAARGLRWEAPPSCWNCGEADSIEVYKDYKTQPMQPVLANNPVYLPPKDSNTMYGNGYYPSVKTEASQGKISQDIY